MDDDVDGLELLPERAAPLAEWWHNEAELAAQEAHDEAVLRFWLRLTGLAMVLCSACFVCGLGLWLAGAVFLGIVVGAGALVFAGLGLLSAQLGEARSGKAAF